VSKRPQRLVFGRTLIFSNILFRGRPGRHWYWRHRMMERWEKMTPEEREKFRQAVRGRCSSFGSPAAEPKGLWGMITR